MRINIATAQKLISNYKQNHWTIVNGCCPSLHQNPQFPNAQDSRSVWFGLADLNAFIADIQAQGGDGIRFYFGEYSADVVAQAALPPQYIGLHTLVMIPTKSDAAGVNRDINITNPANQADFTHPDDLAAEDHGGMAPPPWPVNGAAAPGFYTNACGACFLDI